MAVWPVCGGGGSSPTIVFKVPFSFNDPSPKVLGAVLAGDWVVQTTVKIVVPFDAPGATVQIGTTGFPGSIMPVSSIDPTLVGTYSKTDIDIIAANTNLEAVITPLGSTQGSGFIYVEVAR